MSTESEHKWIMHFFIEIKGKCSSADLVLNLKYIGTREEEEVRGGGGYK